MPTQQESKKEIAKIIQNRKKDKKTRRHFGAREISLSIAHNPRNNEITRISFQYILQRISSYSCAFTSFVFIPPSHECRPKKISLLCALLLNEMQISNYSAISAVIEEPANML